MTIALVDYGAGNLTSVKKAFLHLGATLDVPAGPTDLERAAAVVVPGVGHFSATRTLTPEWHTAIRRSLDAGRPLLGICVGLQMLFEGSEETPGISGLGLLKGTVKRFSGAAFEGPDALKVPQIGWNALSFPREHVIFKGLPADSYVYFVHSFYACPDDPADAIASAEYGLRFCAAAGKGNIAGVQFHPEKSQAVGLRIIKNWGDAK